MTGPDDDPHWDQVVDVICVGAGPGLDGYAMACAAADLEVLSVAVPPGGLDASTADYLSAMTEGLDIGLPPQEPAVTHARAVDPPRGRGVTLAPFVGEDLRVWSSRCLASSSGVVMTHVPDHILAPMHTSGGELITAAMVPPDRETTPPAETFAACAYVDGAIAGASLDGPSGRRLVRARCGMAFAVGRRGAPPVAPPGGRLAMVGRPAGRFARLEILATESQW